MSTDWTPGPWKANGGQNVRNDDGVLVAVCSYQQDSRPLYSQRQANARLCAAAPDLYRELSALVAVLEVDEELGKLAEVGILTLPSARAAIAKAEGRQTEEPT